MGAVALSGGFADPAVDAARAFRAALSAMARPGRIERVAGPTPPGPLSPAAAALVLTLCDGETPLHLAGRHDTADARDWIRFHTGAPLVPAEAAVFALGSWDALVPVERFAVGTPEYPDRSATLIVELDGLEPRGTPLTGPGIRERAALPLPDPAAFRANAALYPLGRDVFLTAGHHLAAVPRSTRIHGEEG